MRLSRLRPRLAALILVLFPVAAFPAADTYTLTLKNHQFTPEELEVPAGKKFELVVKNEDPTTEEFESKTLKREKIVKGNSEIVLKLGPLDRGSHEFFGEFHEKSAKGRLIVK